MDYQSKLNELDKLQIKLAVTTDECNVYHLRLQKQMAESLPKLSDKASEAFKGLGNTQKRAEYLIKLKVMTKYTFDQWQKALAETKSLKSKIAVTQNSLVVSGDDFNINVISKSKKGAQVSISHPSLKNSVTRHLRYQSGILTGNAPFGFNGFVKYRINL